MIQMMKIMLLLLVTWLLLPQSVVLGMILHEDVEGEKEDVTDLMGLNLPSR